MPKYLKIENCGECPYVDSFGKPFGMGTCNDTNKFYNGVKLDTIPEWCPLPDEEGGEMTIDEENQKLKNALTLAVNGMTLVLKVKSSWDKMMIIKNTLACIQETTKGIED